MFMEMILPREGSLPSPATQASTCLRAIESFHLPGEMRLPMTIEVEGAGEYARAAWVDADEGCGLSSSARGLGAAFRGFWV